MLEQIRYLAGLEGGISAQEQAQLEAVERAAAAIKSPALSASSPPVLGVPASYWLDLRSYDPVAAAGRLSQPLLVLQGGRDYQVRPADLAGWQRCAAARKGVQIKRYPALNHLFFAGTGPSAPQEYLQPHPVAAEVIEDVAAWIKGH